MTKDNAKDYLPFVQALAEGKTIQYRMHEKDTWDDMPDPRFSNPSDHYRIKPAEFALPPWANGDVSVLHNPNGLTAEQVGEGWRLKAKGEGNMNLHGSGDMPGSQWWRQDGTGKYSWSPTGRWSFSADSCTLRLPLSVPWPDAPKAPSAPRTAEETLQEIKKLLSL